MGKGRVRVRKIGEMLPFTPTIGQFAREQTGAKLARTATVHRKIDWSKRTQLTAQEGQVIDLLFPRELDSDYARAQASSEIRPLRKYAEGTSIRNAAAKLGITVQQAIELEESAFKKMEVKKGARK